MSFARSCALLFLVLAAAFSLGAAPAAAAAKGWSVLVYMMAENDLEESALADLEEMAASGAGSGFNLLVLADRGSKYSAAGAAGLPAWSGARLLAAEGGKLISLADWGATDMGSPATLSRFLAEAAAARPAERYALVFWDHGSAWNGFGIDEGSGSSLSLEELREGVTSGLAKAAIPRLDLVGFDACLMASYEALSAFRGKAAYFLASEELEPGHGWDYRSLSLLSRAGGSSPVELGRELMKGFAAQAGTERVGDRVTLSLIELGRLPELDSALDTFVKAAGSSLDTVAGGLGRVASSALAFGRAGSPERDSHMVDLGSLAAAAEKEAPELSRPAAALRSALARAVVAVESGSLLKASSGISIYFPNQRKLYDEGYAAASRPQWKGLLVAYYDAGAEAAKEKPPRFAEEEHAGRSSEDEDFIYLSGRLEPGCAASVVSSTLYYGIVDEGVTVFVGDEEAIVDQESGEVEGAWDRTLLVLRQGRRETFGYLSSSGQEEGRSLFSIPFAYFADGRTRGDDYDYAYLDLLVDEDYEFISSTLYKESDEGMTAELRPVKGSKLVPLVEVFDDESGESSMETTEDWGFDARDWESIELDFVEVEGMSTYLELEVVDAADNSDYVFLELDL